MIKKKLVVTTGIEPVFHPYRACSNLLNYVTKKDPNL